MVSYEKESKVAVKQAAALVAVAHVWCETDSMWFELDDFAQMSYLKTNTSPDKVK